MTLETKNPASPANGESWENLTREQALELYYTHRDRMKGRGDVHSRVDWLLEPRLPLTTSILTQTQVKAVKRAYRASTAFPIMNTIKRDADKLLLANLSLEGTARKQGIIVIQMEEALKRLGVIGTLGGEQKKPNILARNLYNRDWQDKEETPT